MPIVKDESTGKKKLMIETWFGTRKTSNAIPTTLSHGIQVQDSVSLHSLSARRLNPQFKQHHRDLELLGRDMRPGLQLGKVKSAPEWLISPRESMLRPEFCSLLSSPTKTPAPYAIGFFGTEGDESIANSGYKAHHRDHGCHDNVRYHERTALMKSKIGPSFRRL
ncbi:hypothetical protein M0R45_016511 [Rubus argutus]|uniref:Uncharacterized protein n=1 Tax=Rubus argutus TaxID=59490 RepID=A0AAW1XWF3_RUBAR